MNHHWSQTTTARNVKTRTLRKPKEQACKTVPRLVRTTFCTSREMDFFSQKELVTQTGHDIAEWPLVIAKELMDNSLDACEEADVAPMIDVTADASGITIRDNGPGLPESTLMSALDFTVRASNREAYVAPDRGAQGNALKTLVPMPGVLDPECGKLVIKAHGKRHVITCGADPISRRAIIHASGDGLYPVSKRQLFYACREQFSERTGSELDYGYFANTLLVQDLNRHAETASWNVTADPRGTLTIPNAGREVRIPCGTLAIDEYLLDGRREIEPLDIDAELDVEWPSLAEGQRYQAVLYIEKEGFDPILDEAKIAERFELAIVSNKGQSNVATRRFVDQVCRVNGGVPLFVVHDLDKAGFEISQRLTTVSAWAELNDRVTYEFEHQIKVVDLGLRLSDVNEYRLQTETCKFKGSFASDSIAKPEEQQFLRMGVRVELNAFTSPQFIEWIESKLTEHGLGEQLIPHDNVLADAYRRALALAEINTAVEELTATAIENAESAELPKTLRQQLRKAMKQSREPWDRALYALAKSRLTRDRGG